MCRILAPRITCDDVRVFSLVDDSPLAVEYRDPRAVYPRNACTDIFVADHCRHAFNSCASEYKPVAGQEDEVVIEVELYDDGSLSTDSLSSVERVIPSSVDGVANPGTQMEEVVEDISVTVERVINSGGAVVALDPATGGINWQLKTDEMGWEPLAGCALADDLLVTVGAGGTLYGIS